MCTNKMIRTLSVEDREFSGCIRTLVSTDLALSYDRVYLEIVRCTLTQSKQVNDWRRTTTLTFIKIGDKNCKVIVNSESSINAISANVTERLGLKVVPHPHTYKMS